VAIEEVVLLRAAQSFISDQSEANEETCAFVDYLIELVRRGATRSPDSGAIGRRRQRLASVSPLTPGTVRCRIVV
jgi:hypothetical protein